MKLASFALAGLLALTSMAGADCPRVAPFPADLPWVSCPTKVSEGACLQCGKTEVAVDVEFGISPHALADRWAAALDKAGWKVTREDTIQTKPLKPGMVESSIRATRGHDHVWSQVFVGPSYSHDDSRLSIRYTPA